MMFKPLLAAKLKSLDDLRYPVYLSPKYDGIRAIVIDGVVMSRTMKPIPNAHVQKLFGKKEYNGFDGELIVGDSWSPTVYRDTSSGVMSHDGEPEVYFYVFDDASIKLANETYLTRYENITSRISLIKNPSICVAPAVRHNNPVDVEKYEEKILLIGYEGIMIRSGNGRYKHGRSTAKEQIILKLKRFSDSEAKIVGYGEMMHNDNEATKNELGRTKRSGHKAGKRASGVLGYITVRDLKTNVEFDIGSGFSAAERNHFWLLGDELIGMVVKYKHFEVGVKDKPRFPTFLGFRNPIDI